MLLLVFTLTYRQTLENLGLGFLRSKLHDVQFTDGECLKLLKNIHLSEDLLKSSKLEKDEHIFIFLNVANFEKTS